MNRAYKYFFSVVLVGLTICSNYAQEGRVGDIINPNFNNRDLFENRKEEIKGSPYLFDEWNIGEIKTKLGSVYPNVKLKYAAYSDQLFFLTDDGDERAIAREKVHYFQFNDEDGKSYLFEHIPYHGFLQKLTSQSGVILYKKIEKEIKEAPKNNGYNASTGKDEFFERRTYYVLANKQVVPVQGKKEYLALFPNNNDAIETFIKKNKVKFKKDEKMIDLVEYTNSLGD